MMFYIVACDKLFWQLSESLYLSSNQNK